MHGNRRGVEKKGAKSMEQRLSERLTDQIELFDIREYRSRGLVVQIYKAAQGQSSGAQSS
jgi:hypothetical protein